jgi:CheY-like chemotaxis protein
MKAVQLLITYMSDFASGRGIKGSLRSSRSNRGLKMKAVLVIDPNEDWAKLTARCISEAGHKVKIATSLTQAKRQLRTTKFDLVIYDVGPPDERTDKFLSQLQRKKPHLRVIVFSDHYNPDRSWPLGGDLRVTLQRHNFSQLSSSLDASFRGWS